MQFGQTGKDPRTGFLTVVTLEGATKDSSKGNDWFLTRIAPFKEFWWGEKLANTVPAFHPPPELTF